MRTKILLLSLSVAAFSSCSTAYKSGQTPDDVYYSPVKPVEEKQNNDRREVNNQPQKDFELSMRVRDYRWRDFDDDYNSTTVLIIIATANVKIRDIIITLPTTPGRYIRPRYL